MDTISELITEIRKEIVAQGEGRWQSADEVLIGLNIWDYEDLTIKALRFMLANVDALIEEFDAED